MLWHLDCLIGPAHDPGKQPPVDGPAERVARGRGLRRAEVRHQDLASPVPRRDGGVGGGDGHRAAREAVVELLDVSPEDFTGVVEL